MKKAVLIISATVLLVLLSDFSMAQCAMCKAVAESTSEGNQEMAQGLNSGIIYLMFIPYILFAIAGIVFFRKKIAYFYRDLTTQR